MKKFAEIKVVENGWNKVTKQTIAKRPNSVIVADARGSFFFHAGRFIGTESMQEEAEIFYCWHKSLPLRLTSIPLL